MSNYTFFAKLVPEHIFYQVGYKYILSIPSFTGGMRFHDSHIMFQVTPLLVNSDLLITVANINENLTTENDFLPTLKNILKEAVASPIIDILNYLYKGRFEIEIVGVLLPNQEYIVFDAFLEKPEKSRSNRPFAELGVVKQFEKVFNLLVNPPANNELFIKQQFHLLANAEISISYHLFIALGDLRRAIRTEGCTPLFCYRAIEGVRRAIVARMETNTKNTNKEWKILREELAIDESSLIVVTRLAEQNRHVAICPISGQTFDLLIEFVCQILDRYFLYITNNYSFLKATEMLKLKAPILEFFELPKVKEKAKKYLENYPDDAKLFDTVEPRKDIQKFIEYVKLLLYFGNMEEKNRDNKISRERELTQKVNSLEKELSQAHSRCKGAIALLKKLKQEPTCASQIEEIEEVIALLAKSKTTNRFESM